MICSVLLTNFAVFLMRKSLSGVFPMWFILLVLCDGHYQLYPRFSERRASEGLDWLRDPTIQACNDWRCSTQGNKTGLLNSDWLLGVTWVINSDDASDNEQRLNTSLDARSREISVIVSFIKISTGFDTWLRSVMSFSTWVRYFIGCMLSRSYR